MSKGSSTYLPEDYGKIDLGKCDYLPPLIKNIIQYDSKTYSPLKFSVKAPNKRLENNENF